jgi:hypothetical protein
MMWCKEHIWNLYSKMYTFPILLSFRSVFFIMLLQSPNRKVVIVLYLLNKLYCKYHH